MSRFRKPWRTSTTLYILLFTMVVLPILTISTTILQVYKRDLLQQTTDRTLQTLHAVTYSIEQEISNVVNFSAAVGMDSEVLETATLLHETATDNRQPYSISLSKALGKYSSSMSGRVQSINFFYKDGGVYSYLKDLVVDDNSLRKMDWYKATIAEQDHVHFIGKQKGTLYDSRESTSIVTTIAPSYFQMLHNIDFIYFVFSRDQFEKMLWQNPISGSSAFRIVTTDGDVIASSYNLPANEQMDNSLISRIDSQREGNFVETINGQKMMVAFATVDIANWKIVYQIPYSELMANYSIIYRLVLIATFVVIVVFLFISFYLVHNLMKPIHVLVVKMSRVMDGNLNVKIEASGSAETVTLGLTFNHMMDQIKLLINKTEQQEKAKQKAEFAAMQSQINPHFLINTLNSIKLMAIISRVDNIRNMTQALIRLVSSSFNRGGSLTLLADEVENLKQYIFIMETRYGNKFEVKWEVDETAMSLYILKLLLQPILENAITHGLVSKETNGTITIGIHKVGEQLCIVIADDGVGIPDEQIEKLQDPDQDYTFSGMGILNVHHRIVLHYGQDYGVTIKRLEPSGTKVEIILPIIRSQEENQIVSSK
ncbi:sensor histidine kinase [Paenibacillus alginolyticus]|uniref:histidine kinase n=1 Tax=Paenibacillus alginolyticus TaxID=59839 RepID=A0ABT4GKQ1_9BACL|nr:sensor histidine kinase [Paenibacillus alginolyticus]MCY9668825.1 sensor histidine kinase [Paenibacillus alginolyticus]MCY9696776.1 sensor histidine kinase [Paenibacillus alginolyticus]MEC0148535.1 sensor histidine kinase [Paenibacillus alginolyticus]